MFGMVPKNTETYNVSNIILTNANTRNLSANFITPYDVGPSIWKVSCMKEAMKLVHKCTYREIENSRIQEFMTSKNVLAFTTSPTYVPKYQLCRPFSELFSFIHLLSGGKWFEPECYMDLKNTFIKLIHDHTINLNTRGVISRDESSFLFGVKRSV
jgi:hypothetical protein